MFNLGLQFLVLVLQKSKSLVHLQVSTVCSLQEEEGPAQKQVSARVEVGADPTEEESCRKLENFTDRLLGKCKSREVLLLLFLILPFALFLTPNSTLDFFFFPQGTHLGKCPNSGIPYHHFSRCLH